MLTPLLNTRVAAPTPVLRAPVVTSWSDKKPMAVLYVPLVRLKRAFSPSAVLNPG